jgi:hypothetical protein
MKKEMGSYELVESVIVDCYGGGLDEYNEEIMNDFYSSFEKGEDISKDEFFEFCGKYIDDMSEGYYIRLNWEYIISGDESVYDDDYMLDEDEEDEDEWYEEE